MPRIRKSDQPVRVPSGGAFGQAQELEDAQGGRPWRGTTALRFSPGQGIVLIIVPVVSPIVNYRGACPTLAVCTSPLASSTSNACSSLRAVAAPSRPLRGAFMRPGFILHLLTARAPRDRPHCPSQLGCGWLAG